MDSKKYIENVLQNWTEFCKGHKRFEEVIKNLITENIQLQEENEKLKGLCNKRQELNKFVDDFEKHKIQALYSNGVTDLAEILKRNYSQSDIFCPRTLISCTENQLQTIVDYLTDGEPIL